MARTRHDSAFQAISVSDRPVVLIFSTGLLIGAIALLPVVGWAQELPTGGTVAEGSVNIGARDGSSMTVTQNSDRAVVDWQSFSIGQGGHVGFSQPSSSSAILNRVTGSATSEIHGRMTANGQVFVVNPNGIFIGPNGQVTAGGGFVASTLDTRNEDFMAGRLRFEGLGNSAPVENAGRVTIGRGGYAALLGGQVSNSGVVTVPLGRIGLGAGEQATLDLSGDRFLQIGVPSESDDPGVRALIENSGKLSADGGQIEMRAATARNAARQAINLSGVAEARSVSVRNGAIVLGGGAGGSVKVTGRVTTRARQPVRRAPIQVETSLRPQLRPGGGEITITGRDIALAGATISADGASGGHVRIGGDYQGGGTLPTARSLTVDADTTITANAEGNGDGGRIILWSDLYTQFSGSIGARGGDTGGDGGFVEVSGKQVLAFSGLVDTRAPQGRSGTLLLDPVDVTIQDIDPTTPGYEDSDGNFGPDGTFTAGTSVINVNDLEVNLEMGDVVVSTGTPGDGRGGAGNITVDAPIDWLLASTLTLNSNNNIDVNQPVTSPSGSLVLTAPGNISFFTGADVTVGSLSATATNLSVATADVVENGGGGTVAVQSFSLNGGSWTQNAPVLSAFSATNFEMSDSATFLRAAGGDGSVATPYRLTDIFGLQGVGSQSLLDQNFVIANTIDATGTANWTAGLSSPAGFKPIQGLGFTGFSGTLDGQGFAVDGLFIDTDQAESTLVDNAGLFGLTRGATVTDLALTNVDIQGGPQVGALAAEAINSTFDTITVTGRVGDAVADADYVGGIAGELQQSDLTNSSFTGTIDSDITSEIFQYIGGLAGYLFDGTISGGTFNGSIAANGGTSGTNERSIGGIVGSDLGLVSDSTATGTISVTGQGITQVGGLVGRGLSTDAISNSQAAVDIDVVMTGDELVSAGGLVGEASVSILDSSASGNVTVESGGAPVVGGLIGSSLNSAATEPISNVQASGDVTVTATGGAIEATQGRVGGLIGENIAPISQGQASGNVVVTSAVTPFDVGGFAGANVPATDSSGRIGSITESFATGSVTATLSVDDDNSVGGFVGGNEGSISDSYAEGAVDLTEGGFASEFGGADAYVGGFAGYNIAQIVRTAARGPVDAVGDFFTLLVGGHTGANLDGAITDSYAAGPSVNAVSNTQLSVGGLVGATSGGTITNGFASTAVTFGGSGTSASGGLIGLNFDFDGLTSGPTTPVTGGFWDLDTTGQPDDGAPGDYGTGLTLGEIQDTDGFLATAGAAGWDFETVWAPGDAGNLPALYTIDPVVFARPDPVTLTYGTAETTPITGSVFGGPALYVFDTPGDTLDTSTAFDAPVFSDNTVGTQSVSISPGPFTSALGQDYRAVSSTAEAEITPAPLTVTPDDQTKDYGQTLTFNGTDFTASGLQYADTVDTVTLSSTGAVDTAGVALSPYDILASNALGTGLGNYDITYGTGSLDVQPIPGTITIEDQSKQYGTAFSFAGTEFTTSGFLFSDAVTQMDLASAGAAADAPVAGSPYAITGTVADGTGLANYVLTVQDGSMEVTPAPLTITPEDQSKTYGELFTFDGTEFVATGLLFSDAVTSLALTSAGAAADAAVAGSPYAITAAAAEGTGLGNYAITYDTGSFDVTPAPLTITPDDQSKTYG
ncbi:beta strand repeat-containing protein, partial [Thalassococcus profundi]|uniref:beta strand repeat-containing protein n=1 Tax=Thalassococcus profundi TaxID=2282382 RepID=UPI004058688B